MRLIKLLFESLTLITLVASFTQFAQYRRMRFYVQDALAKGAPSYGPKLSIILPCKGLDPGFKKNVDKLLSQEYFHSSDKSKTNFEVIFSVATAEDPAFNALLEAIDEHPAVQAKLIVAGVNSTRGQKINNQLAALAQVASDSEVLVFVDSDVVARPDFFSQLVAPLQDESVGITTGYRFYIPFTGDWPSLLRSLWNRLTAWELVSPRYAFAWGGAMAIKRENFVKARVQEHWDRSCDDDLSMTTAVKDIGLSVKFVPQCLVVSDGDTNIREAVEWLNRQAILTKIYYPALWRKGILRASILAFWLLAVIYGICEVMLLHGAREYFALAIGLMLVPVEIFFLVQAQGLWKKVLSANVARDAEHSRFEEAYDKTLLRYTTVLPLAHLLLPWLSLYSILTNRIRWRGVNYLLKSPSEIVVLSGVAATDEKRTPIKQKVFF
jgi:cellulose synthase/poly-beta-1,6-N-acetylglucosamine synthase-like glycosyltransferase